MFAKNAGMRKLLTLAILPMLTLLMIGCSSEDNPTGPEDPDPGGGETIKTPKTMIVQSLSITSFPSEKTNGDTWDFDIITAANRRPDLYVTLGESGEAVDYRSKTLDNCFSGAVYVVNDKANSSSKSLPLELSYSVQHTITVYDDDGFSADDEVGKINFIPSQLYGKNNATNFVNTFTGTNGVKVKVSGLWTY
jgi:hypothetical protein